MTEKDHIHANLVLQTCHPTTFLEAPLQLVLQVLLVIEQADHAAAGAVEPTALKLVPVVAVAVPPPLGVSFGMWLPHQG